jgi:hypothetical protein
VQSIIARFQRELAIGGLSDQDEVARVIAAECYRTYLSYAAFLKQYEEGTLIWEQLLGNNEPQIFSYPTPQFMKNYEAGVFTKPFTIRKRNRGGISTITVLDRRGETFSEYVRNCSDEVEAIFALNELQNVVETKVKTDIEEIKLFMRMWEEVQAKLANDPYLVFKDPIDMLINSGQKERVFRERFWEMLGI